MAKLSRSFLFYLRHFEDMQKLDGSEKFDKGAIENLLRHSGVDDVENKIKVVSTAAHGYMAKLFEAIDKQIKEAYKFRKKSRIITIKNGWNAEYWLHPESQQKGFLLNVTIVHYTSAEARRESGDADGEIVGSIRHSKKNMSNEIWNIFQEQRALKDDYDLEEGACPLFSTPLKELDITSYDSKKSRITSDNEEDVIRDFIEKLKKILTREKIKKLHLLEK